MPTLSASPRYINTNARVFATHLHQCMPIHCVITTRECVFCGTAARGARNACGPPQGVRFRWGDGGGGRGGGKIPVIVLALCLRNGLRRHADRRGETAAVSSHIYERQESDPCKQLRYNVFTTRSLARSSATCKCMLCAPAVQHALLPRSNGAPLESSVLVAIIVPTACAPLGICAPCGHVDSSYRATVSAGSPSLPSSRRRIVDKPQSVACVFWAAPGLLTTRFARTRSASVGSSLRVPLRYVFLGMCFRACMMMHDDASIWGGPSSPQPNYTSFTLPGELILAALQGVRASVKRSRSADAPKLCAKKHG